MDLEAPDYKKLAKALRLCQFGECGCGKCCYKELKGDWCTEDNHPEFFDCDDKLKLDAADVIEELTESNNALHETVTNLLNTIRDIGKWISVDDELPRNNAVVVVSDGKRSWDVGQYHFLVDADDRTRWCWKKHTTRKVLWWMYKEDAIPDPPKEDA